MSTEIALRMEHVYKKFRRGERHDSLRDLIPALARRAMRSIARPLDLREQEFWALQDVCFEVTQGEAIGILGHNGAGKSTLLKHLSGIMKPTSGSINVKGRLSALIEIGAGFHPDLTGRENVYLNGAILGMTRAEVRKKFDTIVEFSGLEEFIDTPVKRYSSGMFARLGFSVAAHIEPDVLIVDEVLSVGDFVFQQKGLDKMRSVLQSGATVIFVSHNLRAVADLCDRALLLSKGQIIEDGPASAVVHHYMDRVRSARSGPTEGEIAIESVTVYGRDGAARSDFESGETVRVEVNVKALRQVSKVACLLWMLDDKFYEIFNTSSERLGQPPRELAVAERHTFSFELDLHLARGNFHLCAGLFRYDIEKRFDQLQPAATLLIRSPSDARGVVNLYARLADSRGAKSHDALHSRTGR